MSMDGVSVVYSVYVVFLLLLLLHYVSDNGWVWVVVGHTLSVGFFFLYVMLSKKVKRIVYVFLYGTCVCHVFILGSLSHEYMTKKSGFLWIFYVLLVLFVIGVELTLLPDKR